MIAKKKYRAKLDSGTGLTLPGRISVSKTFMYSQLNYIGCFLPIETERLVAIENSIEHYVRGPLNISKERMTMTRE